MTDDDDDIAYVGDEDEERGPGCLVALSAVFSAVGIIGYVGTAIWFVLVWSEMAKVGSVRVLLGTYFLMVMCLSIVAGGFGFGGGLYVSTKARQSPWPWLWHVAIIAAFAGFFAVMGCLLLCSVLILGVRKW